MSERSRYTEFHPRWYRRHVSTWWWLGSWVYLRFILRELSSLFVAYFVALTLAYLYAISQGPLAYERFQEWLKAPPLIALNVVSFAFVLFHALTWFSAAPRAMVVHVGEKRVPDVAVAGANYAAWVGASAVVAWLMLGA